LKKIKELLFLILVTLNFLRRKLPLVSGFEPTARKRLRLQDTAYLGRHCAKDDLEPI
jgi:hypothetical protein